MNTVSFVLDEISVSLALFKPVTRALLHTILFLRLLERVKPVEVCPSELETLDYVMNPRHSFEEDLEKLRGLFRKKKFIQLTVSLNRITKEAGWFTSEEKVEWERWTIPVRFTHQVDSETSYRESLTKIHHYSGLYVEHVSSEKNAYQIYDASEEKGWTLADLKELLRKGPPSLF